MEMDIFEQIHEDHRRVEDMIRQWIGQGHGEGRTVCDQLNDLFLPHAKAEEISLYADLREHEEAVPHLDHAVEEHRVIEQHIRDLMRISPGQQGQMRLRLAELQQLIRIHASGEEGTTFALARELLSDERLHELAHRFPIDKDVFRQEYWMAA